MSALMPGKMSAMSDRKSGTSSATNLDMFMSRSVRIARKGFRFFRVGALGGAHRAEHGEDVAQTEIVVRLLGQLLLAEAVEDEELLGEELVLHVAARRQLHFFDDLAVGHHHGDAAEKRLEVLGKLLATGVAGFIVMKNPRARRG